MPPLLGAAAPPSPSRELLMLDSSAGAAVASASSSSWQKPPPVPPTSPGTPTSPASRRSGQGFVLLGATRGLCETLSPTARLPAIANRTGSCGAIRRSGMTRAHLTLTVTSRFDGATFAVELAEGELERGCEGLPETLTRGQSATIELRSSDAIMGLLRVGGVPPIPFGVQAMPTPGAQSSALEVSNSERINFVSEEHRQRTIAAAAENLEQGLGMAVSGEGTVAEVSVSPGNFSEMTVTIRRAKKKELVRLAQEQALMSAMEKGRRSGLLAQISRSKMRRVDTSLIDQAARLLKTLHLSEGSYLGHKEIGRLMRWKRVTQPADAVGDDVEPCPSGCCPCNAGQADDGEVCDITDGIIGRALDGVSPMHLDADRWLFQALVKAAMASPEGCVWKSGGKFLLTNEERNQAVTAIVSVLERDNSESDAGKGMRALVAYTEREYGYSVTAIQLNFHPNNKTSHKQHRDIYGAGQKAGLNCTCSFKKCTGTVCYSLGSSRQVQTETVIDSRSSYEPCGEECKGCATMRWAHSGSAMHFNAPWNNNHTHGIPQMEDACGPRISIALLCA